MQRKHAQSTARQPVKRIIKWATKSYQGRQGEYVGVALDRDGLKIGIRTNLAPRWVNASEALTPAEAEAWARFGFRRRTQPT